jgi:hypothetical protein
MQMKRLAKIMLLGAIIVLPACHNNFRYKDDFYNGDRQDAFKRLPLVKPYQLVKAGTWGFKFNTLKFEAVADHIFVDADRFIFGYGNNGTLVVRGDTSDYIIYFLVDLKKKKEFTFYDSASFKNELNKHGFSLSDVYSSDKIYSEYSKSGLLPWHSPP